MILKVRSFDPDDEVELDPSATLLKVTSVNHTIAPPGSLTLTLNYSFEIVEDLSALKCQACKGFIEIHQPNPVDPERILGTCPNCGQWYLIESPEKADQIMVLRLPDFTSIIHPSGTGTRV